VNKHIPTLYLILGLGLLFLIPTAESVSQNLGIIATVLVVGYWAMLGFLFIILLLKKFFAEFDLRSMLYNLWLFLSLMCVAVGTLAILDDGTDKAQWAVWLIFYGGTVGFLKRKEL
jgi:hypothetical protein